ncbi:sulfotransferase [Lutimonas vermicola]|uniref:Sulfotransferase n=1 Tax=Lutimonas vermicola TaxID=414288 RepID=A0ABU9L0B0_9FLAO
MIARKFIKVFKESWGQLHFDRAELSSTVFLAGSARSGTTWVQNILNGNNDYRVMFEPFHNQKTILIKDWSNRLFLRPNNKEDKFTKPTGLILNGKVRNKWVDKFNKKFLPKKRLIKDIRTNLMLKWIKECFPEIKIIYLMRHPCAVVNSRMKLGWQDHVTDFLNQTELVEDYLKDYLNFIETNQDPFERQMIMWCIENMVPLKQLSKDDAIVIFYEDMYENSEVVATSLFHYLDLKISNKVLRKIQKPSEVTRANSKVRTGGNNIDSWQKSLTNDQKLKALLILKKFNLDRIYNMESRPRISSSQVLSVLDN